MYFSLLSGKVTLYSIFFDSTESNVSLAIFHTPFALFLAPLVRYFILLLVLYPIMNINQTFLVTIFPFKIHRLYTILPHLQPILSYISLLCLGIFLIASTISSTEFLPFKIPFNSFSNISSYTLLFIGLKCAHIIKLYGVR